MFVISSSSNGTQARVARKDAGTEIWFIQKKESLAGGDRRAAGTSYSGLWPLRSRPGLWPPQAGPGRRGPVQPGRGRRTSGRPRPACSSAGAMRPPRSATSPRRGAPRHPAPRLFERRGYAATTISDIAEAAGILPGSLYHHFASKEDIAVDLLTSYSQALAELGAAAGRRTAGAGSQSGTSDPAGPEGPEGLIRRLAADVAALAFRHAAAVRLSAYEAPSVATGRFTAAIQFRAPALERAWRIAVQSLAGRSPAADLGLLRFTLQRVTAYAPLYYPADRDADEIATHLCDLLLHGLLTDPPPFEELDRSAAYRTALE